jgi:predicted CoA-binding protein
VSLRDPRREREATAALLDLHEGRFEIPLLDDIEIRALLASTRRIAIVGASDRPERPSNGVLRDLRDAGFDVVPVNPNTTVVAGLTCYQTVAAAVAATGPVDIVDVFRRPDQCAEPAQEAVVTGARCLWLQLGIADREAGRIAHDAGLLVVMDRCTIIEYRRMRAHAAMTPSTPPGA